MGAVMHQALGHGILHLIPNPRELLHSSGDGNQLLGGRKETAYGEEYIDCIDMR